MNTLLWIIFIVLIAGGLIYVGSLIAISLAVWCYAEDPVFWNERIQPLLTDLRDWVDAGNKIRNYPKERFNKFK